jgi:hypothetical protein
MKDFAYVFCIFAVLGIAAGLVALGHSPDLKPGECFQDPSGSLYRVKTVGKYSVYFTTDDEYNPRAIVALSEIPAHLHHIDCPEKLDPRCQGGQHECSFLPSRSQVFMPATD